MDIDDTADTPINQLERTLIECERVLGIDALSTTLTRMNLAGAYEKAGEPGKAIPLLERLLAFS